MNVLRMGLLVEQGPLWLLVESRLQGRGGNRETSSRGHCCDCAERWPRQRPGGSSGPMGTAGLKRQILKGGPRAFPPAGGVTERSKVTPRILA